jgi:hypothetical protein
MVSVPPATRLLYDEWAPKVHDEPEHPGHGGPVLDRLFAEVPELSDAGPDDDFFELGGHSLLATRLIHRIRTTLDVESSLSAFLHHPAPAQLVKVLGEPRRQRPAVRPRSARNA